MGSEPAAPSVVAVVVAAGVGAWFGETLKSLADQDYPLLSVLVVEVGQDAALAERVASFLPEAHLVRVPDGTGFAQAANAGVAAVEGAAHVLVCHDDVSLAPDAVRLLLEEAYRSNAGLTCPKFVPWETPDRILSVGLGLDRLGVTFPLVEPGELDQGQHDAAREVFVAPSGAVLVRTDLWRALGGFNPGAGEPGEDVDLSWRAQLAGARVVVAPQAVARHLEADRWGLRQAGSRGTAQRGATMAPGAGAEGPVANRTSSQREQHRLRSLWTCYSVPLIILVAPVVLFFSLAEAFWAVLHRRSGRAVVAPLAALVRSFEAPGQLWAARRRAQGLRRTSDLTLWKSQSRGSARLRAVVRLRLDRGHEIAWTAAKAAATLEAKASGPVRSGHGPAGPAPAGPARGATLPGSAPRDDLAPAGTAAAPAGLEQGALDEVSATSSMATYSAGGGASAEPPESLEVAEGPQAQALTTKSAKTPGPAAGLGQEVGWKWTAMAAGAVAVLLLIGSRDVLTQALPLVGQLPSGSGGVASWWHAWWSGRGSGSLVSSSFSPPALVFMGLAGVLSLGSANFAVHVMVLGPLMLGPLGAYFGTRRFGSQRGRLVATALYAALPVPYDALAQGHWAGLVGYAAAPWLLGGLCRLGGQAPYPFWHWDGAWPRFVALGLGLAVAASFAPAMLLLVPVVGIAFCAGSLLAGRSEGGTRLLFASLITAVVAFVGLVPWSFAALHSWSALIGAPSGALHPLGLSQVLRLQTGPYGGGVLSWALVVAAAISLFIGRSWRLAWASRLWVVAFMCMALAWAGSRGWFPIPPLELMLAPAGAALVFAVALGAASVESDLSGYRFGWRQFAPAFGAVAALAAAMPFVSWVGNGQWSLPSAGAESSYPFPMASQAGDYRVLWVGSAGSLPLAAQGSSSGVSFATSLDGLPSVSQLWASAGAGSAQAVAQDVTWADEGETTQLGHLLTPLAIRFIVVPVGRLAAGTATTRFTGALSRQVDLVQVGIDPSYAVFSNSAWVPLFSVLAGSTEPANVGRTAWATAYQLQQLDLRAAQALPVGTSGSGSFTVLVHSPAGVLYGAVPDSSWRVTVDGHSLAGERVGGGATSWQLPPGRDSIVLSLAGSAVQHVADVVVALLWALALLVALARAQTKLGTQLTMASRELGAPGEEVSEIYWPAAVEGPSVG